ncbi:MAG TPA: ABC transporter ATP-binding protein [Solirubrobacteraceae bacterium]|nr:ABC transporter ATP-binding protein [Solirubrobacteraceae bacterium]
MSFSRSPTDSAAVSIRGLVKRFGDVVAVNGLELEVPGRVCYGLLGPNGAGKSTTMRILTGQAIADSGDASVLGFRLPAESKLARARMGICPQESNLDVDLCVRDVLEVFARLYRVPAGERSAAVDRALALAGLQSRARDKAVKLSGGMQRRLLIARALIHQPELVLLDEPTVGLDPQVRQELWSLIVALRESGTTVLMSTHYIEEAERLADRVAIMSGGRVVAEGTPVELIRRFAGREVVDVHASMAQIRDLRARASADGLVTRPSGPALTFLHAEDADGRVPSGARRAATLEDVFVRLTGDYVE